MSKEISFTQVCDTLPYSNLANRIEDTLGRTLEAGDIVRVSIEPKATPEDKALESYNKARELLGLYPLSSIGIPERLYCHFDMLANEIKKRLDTARQAESSMSVMQRDMRELLVTLELHKSSRQLGASPHEIMQHLILPRARGLVRAVRDMVEQADAAENDPYRQEWPGVVGSYFVNAPERMVLKTDDQKVVDVPSSIKAPPGTKGRLVFIPDKKQ